MKRVLLGITLLGAMSSYAYDFKISENVLYKNKYGNIENATVLNFTGNLGYKGHKEVTIELTDADGYKYEKVVWEDFLATTKDNECTDLQIGTTTYVHDAYSNIHKAKIVGCFPNSNHYGNDYVIESKSFEPAGNNMLGLNRTMIGNPQESSCINNDNGTFCSGDKVKAQDIYGNDIKGSKIVAIFDHSYNKKFIALKKRNGSINVFSRYLIKAKKWS